MEQIVEDGYGHAPQSDDDLIALNQRIAAQKRARERAQQFHEGLKSLLRRAVWFYWLVCGFVIAVGLDAVYPGPGRHLARVFQDPALELTAPFATCVQAHANGYYSIPSRSPAYVAEQDGDADGRACEPARDDLPNPMWRIRIMQDRLFEPW